MCRGTGFSLGEGLTPFFFFNLAIHSTTAVLRDPCQDMGHSLSFGFLSLLCIIITFISSLYIRIYTKYVIQVYNLRMPIVSSLKMCLLIFAWQNNISVGADL